MRIGLASGNENNVLAIGTRLGQRNREKPCDQRSGWGHTVNFLNRFRTPLDVPIALFLVSALGGLWASYDHDLSWPALAMVTLAVMCYYAVVGVATSEHRALNVALCGLASGSALAVFFVTQYSCGARPEGGNQLSWLRNATRLFPCVGPSVPHPNSVATFLEGWAVVAVAVVVGARPLRVRILIGISAAILVLAILLSESLGAWISLALCLPLWWTTRSSRNLIVAMGGIAALMLSGAGYFALASGASVERMASMGRTLLSFFDRPDRIRVYRGSWYLIQDFPFTGIGLGDTFSGMYSRYVLLIRDSFLTYSHNLFLQVWLNQGLLGILAFLWLIVAFFFFVRYVEAHGHSNALFRGAWLGTAASLLHGLTDARQYADRWTFLPFFALLGLAVAIGRKSIKEPTRRRSLLWKGGGLIAAALLGIALVISWRPVAAMAYGNLGALSQARGEMREELTNSQRQVLLEQATDYYRRAVTLDSENRTAHQRLGTLAMDAQQVNEAITHLETAYETDPSNTTTRKALGLAYTWAGHLNRAETLLAGSPDITEELNVWGWWWGTQDERQWSANAYRVSLRLEPDQPSVREALAAFEVSQHGGNGSSR